MVDRLLIGMLTGGHVLLEGVPGLAKTLAATSLAQALSLKFRRIQFTPDLLPADLTGTLIYNPRDGSFTAKQGPVFAHLVLADEINRAPAKVQSALLEAMQELQVTLGDETHRLEQPFLVLATQNPIEQEGTYPLPEAQSDRFMFKVKVGYPERAEEKEILRRAGLAELPGPQAAGHPRAGARGARGAQWRLRGRQDPGVRARPRRRDAPAARVRPDRHGYSHHVRRPRRARRCSSCAARRATPWCAGGRTCSPTTSRRSLPTCCGTASRSRTRRRRRVWTARRSRVASWSRCAFPDGNLRAAPEGAAARDPQPPARRGPVLRQLAQRLQGTRRRVRGGASLRARRRGPRHRLERDRPHGRART